MSLTQRASLDLRRGLLRRLLSLLGLTRSRCFLALFLVDVPGQFLRLLGHLRLLLGKLLDEIIAHDRPLAGNRLGFSLHGLAQLALLLG